MTPSKLTITFDNGKQYTIKIYRAVDNSEDWIAYSNDIMSSSGHGKTWDEALQNCIASIREITSGNIPVPIKQELDHFQRMTGICKSRDCNNTATILLAGHPLCAICHKKLLEAQA